MAKDINNVISELVSLPFNKVRNRVELLDLYESVYGRKLCRTCGKDREFAYFKLRQYVKNQIQNKSGE